jgi:YHS domain-containing protein
MLLDEESALTTEYKGKKYYFMLEGHRAVFEKNPELYLNRVVRAGSCCGPRAEPSW